MKIASQTSPEFIQVAKIIEDIPIAMLTTVQADGAMTSRPMTALEMDAQGALWFFTDLHSSKVEQMGEHGSHTGLSAAKPVATPAL